VQYIERGFRGKTTTRVIFESTVTMGDLGVGPTKDWKTDMVLNIACHRYDQLPRKSIKLIENRFEFKFHIWEVENR
jgi:hypothetical protein